MTALIPMAMYGLEVPAGDIAISARPDIPSAFRITMAAIDPTVEGDGDEGEPMRATLKVIRQPLGLDDFDEDDYSDEDDFDPEEMDRILASDDDEDDDEEDEDVNGGPSDPAKSKKARVKAILSQLIEANGDMDIDEDDDSEDDDDEELVNGLSAKAKGKLPAGDDDSEEDDSEDSDDDLEGEIEEYVICTLDPNTNFQQTLDITFGEDERVWFKVTGTHSIFLTGNYVETVDDRSRLYDPDDDEEDEYDLEPDSDELDDEYDEEDELDDLEDPRIEELVEEEEAPKLVAAKPSKSNKRAAPEDASETLDEMIAAEKANGEKLSKKQQKKLKKNDGSAVAVEKKQTEVPSSNKSEKKVAFAKELEQGPTPTKAEAGNKNKAALGVKTVQGVTIDDKKLGTGPAAKSGDRVGMRYIGKLKDGKVFDSNKKGKPFSFKLGAGDVIKGWDIGIAGMAVGGERRITIPAHHGYGSRGAPPDIPPNAQLIFDVKLLEIGKK